MIVPNPSEHSLRDADAISLFDPERPEWHQVIIAVGARPDHGQGYTILDIPVDSQDSAALQAISTRIRDARRTQFE
jgi:hypothetical protein